MDLVKCFFMIAVGLFLVNTACAGDTPVYDNGILTIPAVDSVEQLGFYQDAEFRLMEDGRWELLEARTGSLITPMATEGFEGIADVEIVKTDSFPVQIFLKLSGQFSSGCGAVGTIGYNLENNHFNVFVYYAYYDATEITCTQAIVSFEEIIPLPVYSLPAGEYSYSVNDAFTGVFALERDNELADALSQ